MKESTSIFSLLSDLSAVEAAQRLLGCELVRTIGSGTIRVKIVETEAYDQTDAASHSFNGRTPRTDIMFGPAGHLYVYFTYGMHYCCNVVVGEEGYGAAVLIRAVEPIEGIEVMQKLRPVTGFELCNGPAKTCKALAIDKSMNGHNLRTGPFRLIEHPMLHSEDIASSKRIGISKAKDSLWRFFIQENPYVKKIPHSKL